MGNWIAGTAVADRHHGARLDIEHLNKTQANYPASTSYDRDEWARRER